MGRRGFRRFLALRVATAVNIIRGSAPIRRRSYGFVKGEQLTICAEHTVGQRGLRAHEGRYGRILWSAFLYVWVTAGLAAYVYHLWAFVPHVLRTMGLR